MAVAESRTFFLVHFQPALPYPGRIYPLQSRWGLLRPDRLPEGIVPCRELTLLTSNLIKPRRLKALIIAYAGGNCTRKRASRDAALPAEPVAGRSAFGDRVCSPSAGTANHRQRLERKPGRGRSRHVSISVNEGVRSGFLPKITTGCGL